MSSTGLIRGLVEEGIKQLIQTEVKQRLEAMFPVGKLSHSSYDSYQREWRSVIEGRSTEILKNDPEIQAIIKDQIVNFIKSGIEKVETK